MNSARRVEPAARERAVVALLDRWPWHLGGVIIGGYAVAAFGAPRYSRDVDVVARVESVPAIDAWLLGEKFERGPLPEDLEQNYAGKGLRYERGDVTIDLLPGVVRDREAGVDVPERWIAREPLKTRLFLIDGATTTEVPVCRLTAFWALKLQAGREKDLSDLFMTRAMAVDAADLQAMFRSIRKPSLVEKLRVVLNRLDDPKIMNDALARRAERRRDRADREADWARFKAKVEGVLHPLVA